jgi:hypothetical protein
MTFRKANFPSGHDLREFAAKLGIELQTGDVEQSVSLPKPWTLEHRRILAPM